MGFACSIAGSILQMEPVFTHNHRRNFYHLATDYNFLLIEITFLSIVILLTPGTLVLDVSEDRSKLYVHTMLLDTPEALSKEVKDGFERRILELMR